MTDITNCERVWVSTSKNGDYVSAESVVDGVEFVRFDLVPNWQPIETAPLHEDLLLWCDSDILKGYRLSFGWCVGFDRDDYPIYVTPTHWMPLPAPPEITK